MRAAVVIFAAAIAARMALTPVYYLTADGDAAAQTPVLAGSRENCEAALATFSPSTRCEAVLGIWHLLGAAGTAVGSLERSVGDILRPVEDAQDTAMEAVQDAAQDAAIDAVQDAVGGDGDGPLDRIAN
ncbi:hypothetical protein [Inquilinus sp. Marseille-Q2685]|uniref:hypothetical protein n=1 Tax=Inquilinus sp. Marseille-Q2685 TaxID=2866581 RepID=UPI001CE47C65|nr:hypothetical protein [Inquilinus sp. Marseille-Q2685]